MGIIIISILQMECVRVLTNGADRFSFKPGQPDPTRVLYVFQDEALLGEKLSPFDFRDFWSSEGEWQSLVSGGGPAAREPSRQLAHQKQPGHPRQSGSNSKFPRTTPFVR